jgi:hypothetical protein
LDFRDILSLQKLLFLNTEKAWNSIKSAGIPWQQLFGYYIIPLIFLSTLAVVFFFGNNFAVEFFSINQIFLFTFAGSVTAIYVSGHLIMNLTPRFNGTLTLSESISLIAFAYSPVYLANIVSSMHEVLQVINLVAVVFMVFVFFRGSTIMAGIPARQQLGFTVVSLMIIFVTRLLLSAVFAVVASMINV